jgi:S1-C subfamily serine protease
MMIAMKWCAALTLLASACVVEVPAERPVARASEGPTSTHGVLRLVYEQFPGAPGYLVKSVEPGRAADRAGVMRGDCVMAIGGRALTPDIDLAAFFRTLAPGERVNVELVRDGKPLTVEAVLDPAPPVEWRGPALPKLVFTTSPVCMKSVR